MAILLALNYHIFIVQNHFAPAGLNGIATMVQYKTGFSISYMSLLINIPLSIFAFFLVERKFAVKTFIFALVYSVTFLILQNSGLEFIQYNADGHDTIYPVILSSVISGFIYGVCFRNSGSTGGTDIVSKYIPCYFGYSFANVREWYSGTPLFSRREMGTVWSGAFRLDVIRNNAIRFDESIEINEDAMFLCEYLLRSNSTTVVEDVLYHYMLSSAGSLSVKTSGPEFFKNKLRLLAKREEIDVKSGGRLTSMYAASCVFSLLEILRASFKIKGCLLLGISTFRRYGSDPVVKVALRHFPLSWRKPVLAMAVLVCRFISPLFFRAK